MRNPSMREPHLRHQDRTHQRALPRLRSSRNGHPPECGRSPIHHASQTGGVASIELPPLSPRGTATTSPAPTAGAAGPTNWSHRSRVTTPDLIGPSVPRPNLRSASLETTRMLFHGKHRRRQRIEPHRPYIRRDERARASSRPNSRRNTHHPDRHPHDSQRPLDRTPDQWHPSIAPWTGDIRNAHPASGSEG